MANFSITARQSDIAKWYKDRAAQQANYNTWNDLVKAYTQQATSAFEESTQSAQQSAAYDISQAYANYKQQQIAASLNQNMSAGAKDVISNQLSSAYDISAAQSQYNLASNLQSIYDKYYKTVSTADETLADQFGITDSQIKNTSKGLQYLNKYISESNEYRQLWNAARKQYKTDEAADEAVQAALFKTTGEGSTIQTGLSDFGKQVIGSLLHRGATFGEDENRQAYGDIYDYLYKTNQDAYNLFADQPGLLDEFLELDTKDSVQQAFNEDLLKNISRAIWFNKAGDNYNAKQIKNAKSYGASSTPNLTGNLFADLPNDTSFVADIKPQELTGLGDYQYYDKDLDAYIFKMTYTGKDTNESSVLADSLITTELLGGEVIDYDRTPRYKNGKQQRKGASAYTKTIAIPAEYLTQRTLYKDKAGKVHLYADSYGKPSSTQGFTYTNQRRLKHTNKDN